MSLAFKASDLLTFKASWIEPDYLLLRQVRCPLHHWCYATVVQCLEYGTEVQR